MEESDLFKICKTARPFFVMAGPNVVESEEHALHMAGELLKVTKDLGLTLIYKSSFDKANRTNAASFRGPGLEEGLRLDEPCPLRIIDLVECWLNSQSDSSSNPANAHSQDLEEG